MATARSSQGGFTSPYTPNTDADRKAMLAAIGVGSVDELFKDIPERFRNPTLNVPPPISELELGREIAALAKRNAVPGDYACFLGAGSYRHFIPAIVRQIASRAEFMTCYTPYQPEVAQGTLQAHFEFQSMVCQLTGMEVANSGMYDGATSLAEAALMAARVTGRHRVAALDSVSPSYVEVLKTYLDAPGLAIDFFDSDQTQIDDDTACVIVQQPGFYGAFEDLRALSDAAHRSGALLVVVTDPISLGKFRPPADYDADIVVGEGQALGIAPTFGGPYVGLFSCKQRFIRQMPGRIVGKTVDTEGRTGYVLTMQTREQHIRRERATSNICTSVGLIALMATIYMMGQGKRGLAHVADLCYQKSHYAAQAIEGLPGYSLAQGDRPFFREFVVSCPLPPGEINDRLLKNGIIGGLDVSDRFPNGMLLCVTEMNSRQEIDALVGALAQIGAAGV
jgi:glycine dehydrogenase subunit 1